MSDYDRKAVADAWESLVQSGLSLEEWTLASIENLPEGVQVKCPTCKGTNATFHRTESTYQIRCADHGPFNLALDGKLGLWAKIHVTVWEKARSEAIP